MEKSAVHETYNTKNEDLNIFGTVESSCDNKQKAETVLATSPQQLVLATSNKNKNQRFNAKVALAEGPVIDHVIDRSKADELVISNFFCGRDESGFDVSDLAFLLFRIILESWSIQNENNCRSWEKNTWGRNRVAVLGHEKFKLFFFATDWNDRLMLRLEPHISSEMKQAKLIAGHVTSDYTEQIYKRFVLTTATVT